MARTIKEIANGMKASFVQNSKLMEVYGLEYSGETNDDAVAFYKAHFPKVSVESVLINIVAACVAVVENMMDWHKKEVDTAIARERYGHAGWYEKMALKFRYGENLNANYTAERDDEADSDFAENVEYSDDGLSADDIEAMQIVKYAYCEDDKDNIGVVLKVAKDDNGNFAPLSREEGDDEYAAFVSYIQRIKPAGVPVNVISEGPVALSLGMTIYYNPLVLKSDGSLINGDERSVDAKPVEKAIQGYIKSLGFNGEFTVQALVDAVQQAEGVEIVGFDYARARISREEITHRFKPHSGYVSVDFTDTDTMIKYTPNVNKVLN